MVSISALGDQPHESSEKLVVNDASQFSYGVPSSFHLADDEQKEYLTSLAESEFQLTHLKEEDRNLISDALKYSGVEVGTACQIEKKGSAKIKAFFRKFEEDEHKYFHPKQGMKNMLPQSESKDEVTEPTWEGLHSDQTEYPYPFSEAQVISKAIPVNLSSIQPTGRTDTTASFEATPSALLYGKLPPKDQLWGIDKMVVKFDIDLESRRLTQQTLEIVKSLKVFRGIRVTRFRLHYDFTNDSNINRNVMSHMDHQMAGRLYFTFRPTFHIVSDYSYGECEGEIPTESYLFQSIAAIQKL